MKIHYEGTERAVTTKTGPNDKTPFHHLDPRLKTRL